MRLVKHNIEKDGSGSATLCPDEPEDMWHAYNLIRPGDLLTASAVRRVNFEAGLGNASQRVHTNFTIKIKSTDFDPQAAQLHVSGKIAKENPYTKVGQFHTLDLELKRNFVLHKEVDDDCEGWDSVARAQLREATDPDRGTEAVAVVMQEGIANICFLTQFQTILRQKVEVAIPRKRTAGTSGDHDKALEKFHSIVLETLLRNLQPLVDNQSNEANFPVLLASPGFTATSFMEYIRKTAALNSGFNASKMTGDALLQSLLRQKKFVVIHSSSGHVHSLNEVLKSPEALAKLKNTKYARETALMDKFFTLLRQDDGRAWYGPSEVEACVEKGAVGRGGGVLLISNALFRSQDVAVRRRWVRLADRVRDVEGGELRVLSSDHESGKRLEGLGGIAAILTFPIDDLEPSDDEEE